ncbi:MAG: histidine kinase, partial [Bacteroidota bacterium]
MERKIKLEWLLVLGFYAFMLVIHYITLIVDIGVFFPRSLLIHYFLKAVVTLPFWWLFFQVLRSLPLWKKIALHFFALPLYTFLWVIFNNYICDLLGLFRMQGQRQVWDYYLTVLFYIVQFGGFHLYYYYKEYQEQQLLAANLSKLHLQSELSALKAQLNPHFLYNVFNTINAAIPTTAKHARDMVHKLSDLFRYQLKASRAELVTVAEELDFVKKYLDLEKERFGNRLHYTIEVPEDILQDRIPPMIFQPIVENAVKHGIAPMIEGGDIRLQVTKENNTLHICIADTGIGIQTSLKENILQRGIGLGNTNERLEKMYGQGIELYDNEPGL